MKYLLVLLLGLMVLVSCQPEMTIAPRLQSVNSGSGVSSNSTGSGTVYPHDTCVTVVTSGTTGKELLRDTLTCDECDSILILYSQPPLGGYEYRTSCYDPYNN